MTITKAEALRQIAAVHDAWAIEHADDVQAMPDGDSEFHVDQGASASVNDELNAKIQAILARVETE